MKSIRTATQAVWEYLRLDEELSSPKSQGIGEPVVRPVSLRCQNPRCRSRNCAESRERGYICITCGSPWKVEKFFDLSGLEARRAFNEEPILRKAWLGMIFSKLPKHQYTALFLWVTLPPKAEGGWTRRSDQVAHELGHAYRWKRWTAWEAETAYYTARRVVESHLDDAIAEENAA